MSKNVKRIGVLTGGGDCPGLNAVIRSVVKPALREGLEVFGIEDGYLGLIEDRVRRLDYEDVSNILTRGGTILGSSNRANPAKYAVPDGKGGWEMKDVRDDVVKLVGDLGLDVLFVIGGDGTMSGAAELIDRGLTCIGVPKTIDNDLWSTDVTFGYDTAMNTATEAIDKVHTTASSHHRVMVVEIMGRYAGWLALGSGVAGGADVILLPEIPFTFESICETCRERGRYGKRFTIIAAGEGAKPAGGEMIVSQVDETSPDPIRLGGVAKMVADEVAKRTGLESRSIVLGHVQRGGTPTPRDRALATAFGYHAFELLKAGDVNKLVVMKGNELSAVPIKDVANKVRTVPTDHRLIRAARAVGTSFGD